MTRRDASRPRVTAVIPAHNMESFLERAIMSAVRQTYPELDIIVVNDGSTDATRAIAERIAATHECMRVETIANAGVAAARNLGTELARSAYVAYLDGDDLWHPEKIEKQVAALAAHGHDSAWAACYALSRYVDVNDRVLGNGPLVEARGDFLEKHLYRNHIGNGSCLMVRREAALEVGGFDPGYAKRGIGGLEDYEFQLKLLRRYRIDLVGEFLVGYRVRKGQMSDDQGRMSRARIATVEAILADCELPETTRREVLAHARVVAAYREALAGDLLRAAATFGRSLVESPRLTWRWIVELASIRAGQWRTAGRSGPTGHGGEFAPPPSFNDLDPRDGAGAEGEVSVQPRARIEAFRERPAGQPPAEGAPVDRSTADRSARSAR